MVILVINAGSSSVKFTCFNMAEGRKVLAQGLIERIGMEGTQLKYKNHKGVDLKTDVAVKDAKEAVKLIGEFLTDAANGVLASLKEIGAIGHRVVHGGEKVTDPVIIDEKVKAIVKDCYSIAPLHNPPNLIGIEACEAVLPGVPNVGVFDTAFHATMPAKSFMYGIPYEFYSEHQIRRYGFHGTSHSYVSKAAAKAVGRPIEDLKIITCHIGNGASVAAVAGGKCQDTSMGLTPLEGLIMGTRCGDIDPAIVMHIMNLKGMDAKEVDNLLNKKSGLLGLAGIGSSDLRDIETAYAEGHAQAVTAYSAYVQRIKKYIGSYTAVLNGLNVLVFTAGAGENSSLLRKLVCENMEGLGIKLDLAKNEVRGELREISAADSKVKVFVIPTDEECEIAEQTMRLVTK